MNTKEEEPLLIILKYFTAHLEAIKYWENCVLQLNSFPAFPFHTFPTQLAARLSSCPFPMLLTSHWAIFSSVQEE